MLSGAQIICDVFYAFSDNFSTQAYVVYLIYVPFLDR